MENIGFVLTEAVFQLPFQAAAPWGRQRLATGRSPHLVLDVKTVNGKPRLLKGPCFLIHAHVFAPAMNVAIMRDEDFHRLKSCIA